MIVIHEKGMNAYLDADIHTGPATFNGTNATFVGAGNVLTIISVIKLPYRLESVVMAYNHTREQLMWHWEFSFAPRHDCNLRIIAGA